MNHRDRKLLDLAHRLHDCTIRIPGVCQGHSVEGLEPAHANWSRYGKGMGIKAHDCFHAAACHACHAEIDQGKRLSQEERIDYWQQGFERTLLIYHRNGWLKPC